MAMGKLPGGEEEAGDGVFAEINITPLTDIFLVLLIIFMVTSSVIIRQADGGGAQGGLKVNLPHGSAQDITVAETDLPVAVLADGRLVLGGKVISREELDQAFKAAKAKSPSTMVIIQADEGVTHGKVVEIMELAKTAGLAQLAIGVREKRQ